MTFVGQININAGHNAELLQKCRPLNDYSEFVALVRKYVKEMKNLEKAIERAINELPEDSVLKPFLLANKAEVKLMCITEYDEERTLRLTFEEGADFFLLYNVKKAWWEIDIPYHAVCFLFSIN